MSALDNFLPDGRTQRVTPRAPVGAKNLQYESDTVCYQLIHLDLFDV